MPVQIQFDYQHSQCSEEDINKWKPIITKELQKREEDKILGVYTDWMPLMIIYKSVEEVCQYRIRICYHHCAKVIKVRFISIEM